MVALANVVEFRIQIYILDSVKTVDRPKVKRVLIVGLDVENFSVSQTNPWTKYTYIKILINSYYIDGHQRAEHYLVLS